MPNERHDMFNLDKAISEWRQQMLAAGIKTPVPLEELESHLRDDIEQQVRSGLSAQRAFEISVQRIGQANALNGEFKKVGRETVKRRLTTLVGVFVLLLGTAMILPAVGKHKQRNRAALIAGTGFFNIGWAGDEAYGLAWGISLAVGGAVTMFCGIRKRKAWQHAQS
jgi:hypothetical protein